MVTFYIFATPLIDYTKLIEAQSKVKVPSAYGLQKK